MIYFLNLIRWKNLLMIFLVQCIIKYTLLEPFKETHGVFTALNNIEFIILVISTLCIAAAGYIINDIYDIDTDKVNKPQKLIINRHISEKNAFSAFMVLNILGVALGFYLAQVVDKPSFFVIFVVASALLYLYSTALKQMALIGNIVISLVVALSLLVVGVFDLLPVMVDMNRTAQQTFLDIILDYSVFAFLVSLVREIIKDIEDIDGDYNAGMETLPVVIGRDRANNVAFIMSLLPIFAVIYYVITYLFKQQLVVGYFLLFVLGPLIYCSIKIYNAEHKIHYSHISKVLKLVMLTGMLSLLLYQFILK